MALDSKEGEKWTTEQGSIPQWTRDPSKSGRLSTPYCFHPHSRAVIPPSQGWERLSRDLRTVRL